MSPLRVSRSQTDVQRMRASKDDFSYLSAQLSPMPGAWTSFENRSEPDKLDKFIPTDTASESSSPVKYQSEYQSQGEYEFTPTLDTEFQALEVVSPTKQLNLHVANGNSLSTENNSSSEDLNNDHQIQSSSIFNTSVPTQDLNFELKSRSNSLSQSDRSVSPPRIVSNEETPVLTQNTFLDLDKTPKVNWKGPTVKDHITNTDSLSNMDKEDIFQSGSNLIEDFGDTSFASNTTGFLDQPKTRILSTTSSLYSELPVGDGSGLSIKNKSEMTNDKARKFISTSSSIYSDRPISNVGRPKTQISGILQAIPESNHQTDLNEEEFEFIKNDDGSGDGNGNIDNINSLNNKAPISASNSNMRVSVMNKSLYANYYDSKTGVSTVNDSKDTANLSVLTNEKSLNKILDDDESNDDYAEDVHFDEEDASALFVTSIYAFESTSLESENDSAICLSFDKNEIAFTYNLDDSGWGEVTLLSTLKRGWVPMNYFRSTVSGDISAANIKDLSSYDLASTRAPLRVLLRHTGTFLLNPQSKPVYLNDELRGYTFDIECFNGITDGLRKILVDTDCISRTSIVVQRKPIVRKLRKKLLRGWSDLIGKARDYVGTIDSAKIEYLQLLTFQVLQKAISFIDIWGLENDEVKQEIKDLVIQDGGNQIVLDTLDSIHLDLVYLSSPPLVSYRINEVFNHLLSYLALIAGRIDLVEHNIQSFAIMGVVVGQINLLVNEYIFLMKLIKSIIPEDPADENFKKLTSFQNQKSLTTELSTLNSNSEKLKKLVDELNSYIGVLHNIAKKRNISNKFPQRFDSVNNDNRLYFYSREGGALVSCSCKMVELASVSYRILKNLVNKINDFKLPPSRKYPNYVKMNIEPEDFIQKCTSSLLKDKNVKKQVNDYKKQSKLQPLKNRTSMAPSKRFSIFKAGNSNDVTISNDGLDFLANVKTDDADDNGSPFINQENTFETDEIDYHIEDEILRSDDGNLLGVSFKSLLWLLTDENNPPDYLFSSTFFLTFRIFANSNLLLDELITRFDINDSYKNKKIFGNDENSSTENAKIRSRRKLVAKAFQLWLESYWKPSTDYALLAPLINFFNEAMKKELPVESYRLLVTVSRLIGSPPVETKKDRLNYYNNIDNSVQLLPRKISPKLYKKHMSRLSLGGSNNGLLSEIDAYNAFLDDIELYDLEKIDPDETIDESQKNSALSLNIELKNSNSSLLSKQQLNMITLIIMSYRRMLGVHWVKSSTTDFEPIDTKTLIDSWWSASQESWKILNDDLSLLNFNGLEIAKQLTLIESKMFCSIQVGELLNQNFTTKKLHLNLSPNIQRSILFTNLLSDYVIESILKPNLELRQRIHAFKSWLKVAISCLYLRNFNSLASIMTSLQSFLITRVTTIGDGLSQKYKDLFQYLVTIIHPNKNYHIYREKIRSFLNSNLIENLDVPIVPYLSLFLQDLTFVVDGNPNYRNNPKSFLDQKLINIDKYFKITKIISDIQTLQVSYKDIGELGSAYNDKDIDLVRSATIKNLKRQLSNSNEESDVAFSDMFDIDGVPKMQELILLEIWKVKQTNARDEDRSWKLSCAIQPKEDK